MEQAAGRRPGQPGRPPKRNRKQARGGRCGWFGFAAAAAAFRCWLRPRRRRRPAAEHSRPAFPILQTFQASTLGMERRLTEANLGVGQSGEPRLVISCEAGVRRCLGCAAMLPMAAALTPPFQSTPRRQRVVAVAGWPVACGGVDGARRAHARDVGAAACRRPHVARAAARAGKGWHAAGGAPGGVEGLGAAPVRAAVPR